jgi:hypothetical protein
VNVVVTESGIQKTTGCDGCPDAGASSQQQLTYLTQPHSSDDDRVHSASVQKSNWERIGCVVSRPSGFRYYGMPRGMAFNECHIDKSGRWLILLMNRNDGTRINRIVDIRTGRQMTIDGSEGALGHLDTGYGYAVGAASYAGRCGGRRRDVDSSDQCDGQRRCIAKDLPF